MTSSTFSQHPSSVTPNIGHIYTHTSSSIPVDAFADTSPIYVSSRSASPSPTMTTNTRARARLHKRDSSTLDSHDPPTQPSSSRRRLNSTTLPSASTNTNSPIPHNNNQSPIVISSTPISRRTRSRVNNPIQTPPSSSQQQQQPSNNIEVIDLISPQQSSANTDSFSSTLPRNNNGRHRPYRRTASQSVRRRLTALRRDNLALLARQTPSSGLTPVRFLLLESDTNAIICTVDKEPKCTCDDFTSRREHGEEIGPCKHLIFVFLQVLKVRRNDPVWWQVSLLQLELQNVFNNAPENLDDTGIVVPVNRRADVFHQISNQIQQISNNTEQDWDLEIETTDEEEQENDDEHDDTVEHVSDDPQVTDDVQHVEIEQRDNDNQNMAQRMNNNPQVAVDIQNIVTAQGNNNHVNTGSIQESDPFILGFALLSTLMSLPIGSPWTPQLESCYTEVTSAVIVSYSRTNDPQLRRLYIDIMTTKEFIIANHHHASQWIETTRAEQPTNTTNVQEVVTNENRQREESQNVQAVENDQNKENEDGEQKDECIICLEAIEEASSSNQANITFTCSSCSQVFHKQCVDQWWRTSVRSTCPHCRQPYVSRRHRSHDRHLNHSRYRFQRSGRRERTDQTHLGHHRYTHQSQNLEGSSHQHRLPHNYSYNRSAYRSYNRPYNMDTNLIPQVVSSSPNVYFAVSTSSEDNGSVYRYTSSRRYM